MRNAKQGNDLKCFALGTERHNLANGDLMFRQSSIKLKSVKTDYILCITFHIQLKRRLSHTLRVCYSRSVMSYSVENPIKRPLAILAKDLEGVSIQNRPSQE